RVAGCGLPRRSLTTRRYVDLARRRRAEGYGTAIMLLRPWKSALAPFLAGIPERTGFFGELRAGLINALRWGDHRLERMIDCTGALALPKGATLPAEWPLPELVVPATERAAWLARRGLTAAPRPIEALAPGADRRGEST